MRVFKIYSLIFVLLLILCLNTAQAQELPILGTIPTDKGIDSLALAPNTGIAYGINSEGKSLYIFDLRNYTIKKKIRLDRKPQAIAVNSLSNIAYVTAKGTDNKGILYVIDSDGNILKTISLPKDPQGIAINGDKLVIALEKDKKLLILSTDTYTVTNTISLPHRPRFISLDTDSNRAVIVAGEASGEGKQNRILIVDLNTGNVLYEIELKKEIKSIAVDTEKDIAVAVSAEEITLIGINTGKIVQEFKEFKELKQVDINQSTHTAVITGDESVLLLDLNSLNAESYKLTADCKAVAVDKYKNTALISTPDKVMEVQLPNPVPKITNLIPKSTRANEPGFTLKVEGERFITSSSVKFSENRVDTTFKDNKELEASIPSSLITIPSTVPVTVTNPPPDGGTSDPYPFTIKYPVPVLLSITPSNIAARSPDFTLKAYGSNFMSGYVINFNGQNLQTTFINPGELNAIVPSSLIQIRGIYLVVVITPDGQNSNYLNFTVTDPYPIITDFTPKLGQTGTVVTITGDNFNYTPTKVYFNSPLSLLNLRGDEGGLQGGLQAVIQSLTQTEIKAVVPMGASTGPITVTTSIGNVQSAEPFTVLLRQDFALNISPQSVSIPLNGNAGAVVSLQSTGLEQFVGLVKLSLTQSTDTVTATFNPEYISSNSSSILNIKLLSAISSQPSVLTISGTANIEGTDITRTASLTLNPIAPGATTITGRIVRSKDAMPIKGVTLRIADKTAVTDEAGNFFFADIPVGEQILKIDGHTANTAESTYPSAIPVPVTIIGGIDNKLPYFIYLHEVNTKTFTPINPSIDTIVKDPALPNFEMKIPAGVQIIGWDGLPNEKVSVAPVPIDRLPIKPLPNGVYASEVYMYYFGKPGGGTPSQPIPVKMPNNFQALPGDRVTLWYYDESPTPDPNSNQWKPFGMGTVSDDGRNIIPDPGVGIPKFCCGASFPSPAVPATSPQPSPKDGTCPIADPVDPYNGMFTYTKNDIGYPAPSLINITRLYSSGNTTIGSFGLGTSTDYNHYLQGSGNALTYITPEGGRYIFSKNADGSYTNINYPFLESAKAYLNADSTRVLKFKDRRTYTFDSNGRLIEERDMNDNFVAITRDSLGNITGLIDSFGRRLYITNTSIQIGLTLYTVISSVSDVIGRTVTYGYDSNARLILVTMPDGSRTVYSYNVNNRLLSITNPRGIVEVTNQYDSQGRVAKQTHADGGEYLMYYFSPSTPVRVQDPTNPTSASCTPAFVREGDSAPANTCGVIYVNVPTSQSVPQGSTATSTITHMVVINPNKSSETYRFNGQGYALSVTDGIGGQISYEHQVSTNLLLSVTDKGRRKTTYTYDSNGNISTVTDPAGNVTSYEYDLTFNKPTKITDAMGNVMAMTYDAKGNLISITDPLGKTTTITYNANGQPLSVTNALSNITTFEYDNYGNLIKTTDPLGNSAQMDHDLIGRLIVATDPKGKSTLYSYDMLNRIAEITDSLSKKTKFTYDANGNLLTVNDAKNQTISYEYNERDKVKKMTDQLGKVEAYNYDKMNNLVSVRDREGQTTAYNYDLFSRIVKTLYADNSYTSYFYDAIGRLTTVTDTVTGMMQYVYSNTGCSACGSNAVDKVIQEITSLGSISYAYDAIGRRTSMTVAGQPIVNYNYDANSRLTDINTMINNVAAGFSLRYDEVGRRTSLTLPNGITTNYSYDNGSNLLNIESLNPLNALLEKINYTYDSNGNRTKMDRQNVPVKLPNPVANTSYNQANQMLTFNDKNISYDENGNMETITNSCGTTTYSWDARNRLTAISGYNTDCSPLTASFKYDALGRRIEKTINGKTIQYLYDGLDIVQEIENGVVSTNYIRTLNIIDEPLALINQDGIYYYIYDGLGSVIGLADQFGNDVVQYYYDPFGNTTTNNPSFKNPFQYTGRENDNTGLYAYRPRYYSPELQRFTSEDPIGWVDDINQFAYVGNNPINFVDPLGLFLLSIRYSNNPYGSITVVWNSWLPYSYRSGTRGDNGTEIESGIYKYKYGTHPIAGGYPALNLYSRSGSRTLSATRTDNKGNTAAGINFHRGNSLKSSKIGSKGCHVIPKGNYEDFIDQFEKGDEGYYIYIRLR